MIAHFTNVVFEQLYTPEQLTSYTWLTFADHISENVKGG